MIKSIRERLRWEYRALGFLLEGHPLTLAADQDRPPLRAKDLAGLSGQRVSLAAWLVTGKLVSTKSGEPMEFLTFEDESGLIETTFFPAAYQRYGHLLEMGRPYLIHGLVEEDFGAVTVTVSRVRAYA